LIEESGWDDGCPRLLLETARDQTFFDYHNVDRNDDMKSLLFCFFEFLERIEISAFVCVVKKKNFYICADHWGKLNLLKGVEWMRLMDLTKAVQQKKLKIQDQLKKRGD
jgi:hypothetical protein